MPTVHLGCTESSSSRVAHLWAVTREKSWWRTLTQQHDWYLTSSGLLQHVLAKLLDTMRWHADLMSFSQTCASTPLFSWCQPENTQNWQLCYWHPDLIADSKFTLSMCDRCERVCRDRRWDHHPAWPVWQWVSDGPGRCILVCFFLGSICFLFCFPYLWHIEKHQL